MADKALKTITNYIYRNRNPFLVSFICMCALCLRAAYLYQHTLSCDELYELNLMRGTFLDLLSQISKGGFGTYLVGDIYLVFPFFKVFHYNKWGLAIPCIISTVIGFYVLYLICKRYYKSTWAYLITFGIVCFNATLIQHATEIRAYSLLPTLALVVFYLFERIADLDFKLSILKKTFAMLLFAIVIWFHVYGILMFTSLFLFTLLSRYKEKNFKLYFIDAVFFAGMILCIAMPFWIYCVFGVHSGLSRLNNYNIFQFIPDPSHNAVGFLKSIFCNLIGIKILYFLLLGVIVPFIFSYKDRKNQLIFLFLNIIAPIGFVLLFDLVVQYWFIQRQFIWVMPLFAFFIGWVWDSVFQYKLNIFSFKKR